MVQYLYIVKYDIFRSLYTVLVKILNYFLVLSLDNINICAYTLPVILLEL